MSTGLKFPKPTRAPRTRTSLRSRSPMKRGTPLLAKRWGIAWKRPRRLTPRDPGLVELLEQLASVGADVSVKTRPTIDPGYVDWCHTQPCAFARFIPDHRCSGDRIVMCHEGKKPGMSLKCSDERAFPGCSGGHDEWTAASGEFKEWKKADRREFADEVGPAEYARYLSSGSRRGAR